MQTPLAQLTHESCLLSNCSLGLFVSSIQITRYQPVFLNFSTHVRESKTFLDSGFNAVDSGFQTLDSRSFSVELGFRNPQKSYPVSGVQILLHGAKFPLYSHPKSRHAKFIKRQRKIKHLQRKHRVVLDGLFRVNKSSEVLGDRQREAE